MIKDVILHKENRSDHSLDNLSNLIPNHRPGGTNSAPFDAHRKLSANHAVVVPDNFDRHDLVPAIISRAGSSAQFAWDEFFFGRLRNPHTRRAYRHAVSDFLIWCGVRKILLTEISPMIVGRYFDEHAGSIATRKQHLAALRHFFDAMVTRHEIILNPSMANGLHASYSVAWWRILLPNVGGLRNKTPLQDTPPFSFSRQNTSFNNISGSNVCYFAKMIAHDSFEDHMGTLTAILCNYNHGKLISRAIDAMLTQSRPPDELIIVDDGSTDDSCAIIEAWAAKSSVIKFLRNVQNLGFHASAARALATATGDYVYSGAADDYILPGFFESVCGLMDQHPSAGVGCAKVVTSEPSGQRVRSDGYQQVSTARYLSPAEYLQLCLEAEPPTHSLSAATIYRREELLRVRGWRKDLGSWCDTFAIRAIALRTGMCYVPQEGVVWFVMPGGMSQSTGSDPRRALTLIRRAAHLMRSQELADVFPGDHVERWEAASFEALVLQQLQPAIDGYQAVQETLRATAGKCSWPMRCLLGFVRRCMTVCYLAAHHLQRCIIRRWLIRLEQRDSHRAPTESAGTS